MYAGQDHAAYLRLLRSARRTYEKENLKLGWFRDYRPARREFRAALDAGNELKSRVEAHTSRRAAELAETAAAVRKRLTTLDSITLSLVERGEARKKLSRASVLVAESEVLMDKGKFDESASALAGAAALAGEAERAVESLIARYLDPGLVQAWKKAVDETIAESRRKGSTALIVSKLERRLLVYKNGSVIRAYDVGLGFNGLADKRHSGDNATPEGRYSIIKKIPYSQYHKALLINYPNEEDKKWFAREKAKGNIPGSVSIGGDVEIHGGGQDSLTRGCVSLDNDKMDELFALVTVGTPVTIIGTLEVDNFVIKAIRDK